MKKITVLLLVLLMTKVQSQNLVNNPSFESYTTCPTTSSQFYAVNWQVTANSGLASPDYYNTCADGTQGIPSNVVGNQNAYTGNGYAGIYCYYQYEPLREYIQSQLNMALVAGQTYYVSFRVSLADDYGTAIGSIGAHFSTTAITGNGTYGPINVVPQIISSSIISDTANWVQITGSFVANGGEQYITIGNFSNDASTPRSTNSSAFISYMAYYYVDMVEVSGSPLKVDEFKNSNVSVVPNPFKDLISLDYKDRSSADVIEVYSVNGVMVKRLLAEEGAIKLSELPSGVYFISIVTEKSEQFYKKIIKI